MSTGLTNPTTSSSLYGNSYSSPYSSGMYGGGMYGGGMGGMYGRPYGMGGMYGGGMYGGGMYGNNG